MPDQLFPLGRVMMTTNLQGRVQEANPEHWEDELKALIARTINQRVFPGSPKPLTP